MDLQIFCQISEPSLTPIIDPIFGMQNNVDIGERAPIKADFIDQGDAPSQSGRLS